MERVDGRVPPDLMPYTEGNRLYRAEDVERAQLACASAELLAERHRAPVPADPAPDHG